MQRLCKSYNSSTAQLEKPFMLISPPVKNAKGNTIHVLWSKQAFSLLTFEVVGLILAASSDVTAKIAMQMQAAKMKAWLMQQIIFAAWLLTVVLRIGKCNRVA
eukprot:TRINITY_DN36036_c0_g1_i1.p1 TRINITY_DN36036_c0_g1~~TRINITY_DN36036_c0_g1_i1.p1  ORF type:complete len:103 (+),score=18.46 TRINITY_DN36036_c0_g1_i1:137-445(+)